MDNRQLKQLLEKYLSGTLSEQEYNTLQLNLDQPGFKETWEDVFGEVYREGALTPISTPEQKRTVLGRILQHQEAAVVDLYPRRRYRWLRVVAAAAVLLALAGSAWLLLRGKLEVKSLAGLPQSERFQNDIAPAAEGVTLTTGHGQKIRLDSAGNNRFTTDDVVQVTNADGTVAYTAASEVYYHTIATHKGKDYRLTLADGTKVWLDALSSIRFPTAFPGKERVVEISGQAYFEVAKDATKPFKVRSGVQEIEVLGTHFNVNAYEDVIRTTLLEGSVRLTQNAERLTLKPGEQAVASFHSPFTIHHSPDLDEVMSWKYGRFRFNGTATMQEIMHQLERWYDIDVKLEDSLTDVMLVGRIGREEKISRILDLLEKTKQVEFSITGNTVTVMKVK